MISPIKAPAAHDLFKVDSLYSPTAPDGKTTITECNGRELTWQEQQAPGLTGAFVVFRGEKLVSITYRIELWTDNGFQTYAQLESYLNAAKNARPPRGLKLVDLRLAGLRIPQVALARLPYQVLVSPGLWAYEVKFQEYKRLQLGGGAPQPPQNPRQALIVQLQKQRDGLAAEAAAAEAAARAKK
jgi:hypothetical protein